jgi:hypothetical protein
MTVWAAACNHPMHRRDVRAPDQRDCYRALRGLIDRDRWPEPLNQSLGEAAVRIKPSAIAAAPVHNRAVDADRLSSAWCRWDVRTGRSIDA